MFNYMTPQNITLSDAGIRSSNTGGVCDISEATHNYEAEYQSQSPAVYTDNHWSRPGMYQHHNGSQLSAMDTEARHEQCAAGHTFLNESWVVPSDTMEDQMPTMSWSDFDAHGSSLLAQSPMPAYGPMNLQSQHQFLPNESSSTDISTASSEATCSLGALTASPVVFGSIHNLHAAQDATELRIDTTMVANGNSLASHGESCGIVSASQTRHNTGPLASPILTIQSCDNSPHSGLMNHATRQTRLRSTTMNGHLSPCFDEDQYSVRSLNGSTYALSGASSVIDNDPWCERNTGGLSPIDRDSLNTFDIPSLNDMEKRRALADRNAIVEGWLENDEGPGSDTAPQQDAGDHNQTTGSHAAVDVSGFRGASQASSSAQAVSSLHNGHEARNEYQSRESAALFSEASVHSGHLQPHATDTVPSHRLWVDAPADHGPLLGKSLPGTAHAAIVSWHKTCARKEPYEASITATINTIDSARRRSVSDFGSLYSQTGLSRQIYQESSAQRKGISSFISEILPLRASVQENARKRKSSQPFARNLMSRLMTEQTTSTVNDDRLHDSTSTQMPAEASAIMSPSNASGGRPPLIRVASARLSRFRNRSKSDCSAPGLTELWRSSGGPPIGSLAVPKHGTSTSHEESTQLTGEIIGEPQSSDVDLDVRTDGCIEASYDGFEHHILSLNPAIEPFLLKRLSQVQLQRYKRLVRNKIGHLQRAQQGHCASRRMCCFSGGLPEPITTGVKASRTPTPIFIVDGHQESAGDVMPNDASFATFRQGVPRPLVQSLPARFECPYCFEARNIEKPCDWTKHIDEDVLPFTCTFSDCADPRSFKRKADWVRHERETHRKLEVWTCIFRDCGHQCYRRDNFVQHLVREHEIPDPKVRNGRKKGQQQLPWTLGNGKLVDFGHFTKDFQNEAEARQFVNAYVDERHALLDLDSRTEPCRFCGLKCDSWSELESHLARHMLQITMPILGLVESYSSCTQQPLEVAQLAHPVRPVRELPSPESSNACAAEALFFAEPHDMEQSEVSSLGSLATEAGLYSPIGEVLNNTTAANQFGLAANQQNYRPITYPVTARDILQGHSSDASWLNLPVPSILLQDTEQYVMRPSMTQHEVGYSSEEYQTFVAMHNAC